jgi:outer membrane protein TolC
MLRISPKLAFFFFALSLQAQQTLSLAQAVAMALDGAGSLEIQLAKAGAQQAQAQADEAHALLLPNLAISATELDQARNLNAEGFRFANLPGFVIPAQVGPYNTFDARAAVQQNVFNAAVLARQKAFRFNTQAQKLTEEQTRQSVAAKVARAYLDILRRRTLVEAIRADKELADGNLSIARQLLAAGNAVPADVVTAETAARQVKIRELDELADYEKAKLTLLNLCNLELTTNFEPVVLKPWDDGPEPESAASRPDIASAMNQVDSARSTDRALQLERLPTVSAFADAGVLGGVETHTIGVSVNLTVFDGGRLAARREEALSILRQGQIKLKQLQRKAQLELAEADLAVKSARQQLALAQDNKTAADEELHHAQRMVTTGGFDRLLVLNALNRSAHAHVDEGLAEIRLAEAQVAKAETTGSVVGLIRRRGP